MRPNECWALLDPEENIWAPSIRKSRSAAIRTLEADERRTWKALRKAGWKAIRVKVVPL